MATRHTSIQNVDSSRTAYDQQTISKTYRLIYEVTGVDFFKYKIGTINRRLLLSMAQCGIQDLNQYYYYLLNNPTQLRKLFHSCLIPLTAFFRNSKLFRVIKNEILPLILSRALEKGTIRIWVAGCSTGEEVYSIAVCLAEKLDQFKDRIDIKIFGTDVNEDAIQEARRGIYSITRLKGVSGQRLKNFFVTANDGYRVTDLIRSFCIFGHHNLLEDPPFNHLDMISCQNVLIYLTTEAQKTIFDLSRSALNPEGFLILSDSEALASHKQGFKKWKRGFPIYTPDPLIHGILLLKQIPAYDV